MGAGVVAKVIANLPALALGLALLGGGWWIYNTIWQAGWHARDAELQAETATMQRRLHDVADALSRALAELEAARARRDDLERTLADEAANDPRAGAAGLSADSLRRLDRIR